jgi:subtilase family serine protease
MEDALKNMNNEFTRVGSSNGNELHEVVFAIKQRNLDELESLLYKVSNSKSHLYGKFLNRREVANMTSDLIATNTVSTFLKTQGVEIKSTTPYGEYITAVAPISLWENLLSTTFYKFKHVENGMDIYRAVHYLYLVKFIPLFHLFSTLYSFLLNFVPYHL